MTTVARAALVIALVALAVATAALVRHPAPSPYNLVCSEVLHASDAFAGLATFDREIASSTNHVGRFGCVILALILTPSLWISSRSLSKTVVKNVARGSRI